MAASPSDSTDRPLKRIRSACPQLTSEDAALLLEHCIADAIALASDPQHKSKRNELLKQRRKDLAAAEQSAAAAERTAVHPGLMSGSTKSFGAFQIRLCCWQPQPQGRPVPLKGRTSSAWPEPSSYEVSRQLTTKHLLGSPVQILATKRGEPAVYTVEVHLSAAALGRLKEPSSSRRTVTVLRQPCLEDHHNDDCRVRADCMACIAAKSLSSCTQGQPAFKYWP